MVPVREQLVVANFPSWVQAMGGYTQPQEPEQPEAEMYQATPLQYQMHEPQGAAVVVVVGVAVVVVVGVAVVVVVVVVVVVPQNVSDVSQLFVPAKGGRTWQPHEVAQLVPTRVQALMSGFHRQRQYPRHSDGEGVVVVVPVGGTVWQLIRKPVIG